MDKRPYAAIMLIALIVLTAPAQADQKVRVAVVGDSISKIRAAYGGRGWPTELNDLLGDKYEVKTFSANGVTLLRVPSRSVWSRAELGHAVAFKPNIVVILMGANMGKAGHWVHKKRYAGDYRALIAALRAAKSKPNIFLCKPIPVHEDNFGISGDVVQNGVTPIVAAVAKQEKLPLVDTYTPLADKPDTTSDGIHPTRLGHMLIARAVAEAITGKKDPALAPRKDALRLPSVIASRMVLQQDKPTRIWGWAKAGTKITVKMGDSEKAATAGTDGRWQVTLPAMKAGGPQTITITTDKDKRPKVLSNVFVGEVWLIAGGADVYSRVKENPGKNEVWVRMANPKNSLLNLPTATSARPLHNVRATWRPWDRWRAHERSAVAFYFGDELQKKLDVPIGTIVAAKPGAPPATWKAPASAADRAGVYNAMVHPAVGFAIRGVAWFQSGAGATEADVKDVVENWQKAWGQSDWALHYTYVGSDISRPELAKRLALHAMAKTYRLKDLPAIAALPKTPKPVKKPDKPSKQPDLAKIPAKAELKVADVINPKGDGPDGEGNTNDDTWQFWLELGHAPGTYRRLSLATATMSAGQRQKGIPNKVIGPVAARLPNPKDTEGWIFHRDWNATFEGVWGDKKAGHVLAYPYVEKTFHGAVAITYRVPADAKYTISGKLTDLMVRPKFAKHDGILWKLEKATEGDPGKVLANGGPIGDGHGRPDSAQFKIEKVSLEKGQLIRLVIHPNKWWGTDMTRIDYFRVRPASGAE